MSTPFSYFDLIEVFEKPGCAVCNLLLRDADRYISSLLYEYSMDLQVQRTFREARGLCNEHGWQLVNHRGGVLNITVLYSAALDEVQETLNGAADGKANSSWLKRLRGGKEADASMLAESLEAKQKCPACELLKETERFYIQTVSQYAGERKFEAVYRGSDGLCLPHFRQVLRETHVEVDIQRLITMQSEIWAKLQSELESLKDRYDPNRTELAVGEDSDSWRRAIRLLAGEKGVFGKGD